MRFVRIGHGRIAVDRLQRTSHVAYPVFARLRVGDATKKAPTATVTQCEIHGSSELPSADITYTFKNNDSTDQTYWIYFVINDSSGSQVGTGSDLVDISGGPSPTKQTTVYLDASGGVSCAISNVT